MCPVQDAGSLVLYRLVDQLKSHALRLRPVGLFPAGEQALC